MLDFNRVVCWISLGSLIGGAIVFQPVCAVALPAATPRLAQQTFQQGDEIRLNDHSFLGFWEQWQTPNGSRTGISDDTLRNQIGVQLLNTDSANLQSISWFTPVDQTLKLPSRIAAGSRYLDVTDLARQSGWQLTANGTFLQIETTPTQIVGIRQSQQPWGDRLVIELDQPAPWQTTQLAQSGVLSLDAQVDRSLVQQFKPIAGRFLSAVNVEPSGNQTNLRLGISDSAEVRVWSLAAPNRIVIDVRPDAMVEQNILWAPGLRWRQQLIGTGDTRLPVTWLEINPKQPGISLQPIVPNLSTMTGIAPLNQTAQGAGAVAAINGGFFNRDRQLPLGAIRLNGQWLSGPILNRGAIAWDDNGNVAFGRLTLQETITTQNGQQFPLTHLNSGYVQAGIARYTTAWGTTYTTLTNNETIVFVQNNRVVDQQIVEIAGTTAVQIPNGGYILVLRSNRSAAPAFTVGTSLQLVSATNPPEFLRYRQIMGAGPLLIQNGQIVLDAQAESFSRAFTIETAARSAIAQRADGTLLLVTAHQRLNGSRLSLLDMAQLLQQLGAVNALNLDGGSSTTLYLGGQVLDRPPPVSRVHNGIGVFLKQNP